ncbi:MAG: PaaI family thioesterase [Ignavibacteria bacterium]
MMNMLKTYNPAFRETIIAHLEKQEFMKAIGASLTSIELGKVIAEIPLQLMHQQQISLVHGGVTATIADIAAGFAGFTLVGPDEHTVTAEIKVSYLRPAKGILLRAVGSVMKQGRTMHFCEAHVYCINEHGDEELIAHATTTMAIIKPKHRG